MGLKLQTSISSQIQEIRAVSELNCPLARDCKNFTFRIFDGYCLFFFYEIQVAIFTELSYEKFRCHRKRCKACLLFFLYKLLKDACH